VSEADFLLVLLSEQGKCQAVVTEDADILVAGALHTIRNFIELVMDDQKRRTCQQYDRIQVIDVLDFKHQPETSLLELASILHCDYQLPIRGLGPVNALRYIQKYGTVKAFLCSSLFETRTKKTNRAKFQLPVSKADYIVQTGRTVDIFQSRPDIMKITK
jgi:5'-3' exonuclease